MNSAAIVTLEIIGTQLDNNIFPLVKNGGVVVPSTQLASQNSMLEEVIENEQQRQRRSPAKQRQRHTRRQRETCRSRSTSDATSIISTSVRFKYESELDELCNLYPNTKVWHQSDGLWLLTHSTLLEGSFESAVFITCLPFNPLLTVKSWGFWNGLSWIGERHTNFPDGSICAFEPKDNTWTPGDSIVKLIDLYSLWAVRHLHLSKLKYWPGYQSVHFTFERLLELKDDEFCGCSNFKAKYKDCCKSKDINSKYIGEYIQFLCKFANGVRKPPTSILDLIFKGYQPPKIKDITS